MCNSQRRRWRWWAPRFFTNPLPVCVPPFVPGHSQADKNIHGVLSPAFALRLCSGADVTRHKCVYCVCEACRFVCLVCTSGDGVVRSSSITSPSHARVNVTVARTDGLNPLYPSLCLTATRRTSFTTRLASCGRCGRKSDSSSPRASTSPRLSSLEGIDGSDVQRQSSGSGAQVRFDFGGSRVGVVPLPPSHRWCRRSCRS